MDASTTAATPSILTEANLLLMNQQIQHLAQQNAALNSQVQHLSTSGSSSTVAPPTTVYPAPVTYSAPRVHLAPNKPPTFDGKSALRVWMGAMDRWLIASKIPDTIERVEMCVTFLDPSLGNWWDSVSANVTTWTAMKDKMKERWQPAVQSKAARARLDNLRQRGSVLDYYSEFLSLAVQAENMHEADKLHAFKRGLHPRLHEKLEEKELTTVIEAMNAATMIEERRRQYFTTQYPSARPVANFQRSYNNGSSSSASTSTPMEISHMQGDPSYVDIWEEPAPAAAAAAAAAAASPTVVDTATVLKQVLNAISGYQGNRPPLQRLNKLTYQERQQLMRENKCFKCRKVGHRADSCPTGTQTNKTIPSAQQSKN